jgi:hypothetical protein
MTDTPMIDAPSHCQYIQAPFYYPLLFKEASP